MKGIEPKISCILSPLYTLSKKKFLGRKQISFCNKEKFPWLKVIFRWKKNLMWLKRKINLSKLFSAPTVVKYIYFDTKINILLKKENNLICMKRKSTVTCLWVTDFPAVTEDFCLEANAKNFLKLFSAGFSNSLYCILLMSLFLVSNSLFWFRAQLPTQNQRPWLCRRPSWASIKISASTLLFTAMVPGFL